MMILLKRASIGQFELFAPHIWAGNILEAISEKRSEEVRVCGSCMERSAEARSIQSGRSLVHLLDIASIRVRT